MSCLKPWTWSKSVIGGVQGPRITPSHHDISLHHMLDWYPRLVWGQSDLIKIGEGMALYRPRVSPITCMCVFPKDKKKLMCLIWNSLFFCLKWGFRDVLSYLFIFMPNMSKIRSELVYHKISLNYSHCWFLQKLFELLPVVT